MSGGWFGGLYRWITGTPQEPSPKSSPPPASSPASAGSGDDSKAQSATPPRIGHYKVTRKIGAGGMGVVYEAYDERLERSVALKMMLRLDDNDNARRRFWREARAAASVNHPNVCQIYEVGEEGGNLFIAMELLDGEALTEQMARGAMSIDRAVPIATEILAALGAIHARGIVHRDLKPSNVFLTRH